MVHATGPIEYEHSELLVVLDKGDHDVLLHPISTRY